MWICLLGVGWICCLVIARQDFRRREIHVGPLLLFGLLGGLIRYREWGQVFWHFFLSNIIVVGILLVSILLFFRLKGEKEVMDVKLGWGDIVMLLGLASWMEPTNFLLLYSLTTAILSLLYSLLRRFKLIDKSYPIPLAGWWALAFGAWSIYGYLS